jgi:hypothetical protein
MELAKVRNRIRGWFPKEPFATHSKESGKRKSSITAYVVGYGVALGISEGLLILVETAGWGAFESSLSSPFNYLAGMLVSLSATMLALAIGAKLSRKLKERWIS